VSSRTYQLKTMTILTQASATSVFERSCWRLGVYVFLMKLLTSASVVAQASKAGADLEGTVTDQSDAPVAGAQIEIRNAATGLVRPLTTDDRGFFRASELPIGSYVLKVRSEGFAPYLHTGITMTIGRTIWLEIRLFPAKVIQKVTVTAEPPAINPAATSAITTVDRERIEELPVRTRNALDFVLLAPGVTSSNPTQASNAQTVPLVGSGFSFAGLRPTSNSFSIDSLENDDEFSGGTRTELSPEVVQEFQVVNNGLSAEYGGGSGGSIDLVTRSGANTSHGDAFVFAQTGALNARQPIEAEALRPRLTRYRGGLSRGGPIIKDRTFYYAAFEQEHIRTEEGSDVSPDVTLAINSFLSSGAFPRLPTRRLTPGLFPVALSETEASAKLDHQLTNRNSLMLRYAFTNHEDASASFNVGGLADASAAGSAFTRDSSLAGSLTTLKSSTAVNQLGFQVARRSVALRTNDQTGPGIVINGLVEFGRPYAGNSRYREDHYDVSDVLAVTHGRHFLKAGGGAMYVHASSLEPDGFGASYIFPTLADFFASLPDTFRQAFGDPRTAFGVTGYGGFFEDHWSVNRRTTLDLGLRYDFEHLPRSFKQATNNFSPRVGLAYSPADRWVLRAGYGIFFDRYVLGDLNRAMEKDGVRGFEQVLNGAAAASLFQQAAGGGVLQPLASIAPSIFRADSKLATPYSQQASFGVEHLLGTNLKFDTNYLYVRGVKLSRTVNINLPPPIILTPTNAARLGISNPEPQQLGREVFGANRLDPQFSDVNEIQDSAISTYNGFSVSLERHVEDFTLSVSYTVSKATDDASSFSEQPQNPFNLRDEYALSLNDQRHRFVLSGLIELPLGDNEGGVRSPRALGARSRFRGTLLSNIELAPILTVAAGRPVNPITGLDSNRNDALPFSSRPLGISRNTLLSPPLAGVDLRILKSVYLRHPKRSHLDLVVEFFNLLNHTNVNKLNPNFGPGLSPMAGFGLPVEALNARQIEFSLDFEY